MSLAAKVSTVRESLSDELFPPVPTIHVALPLLSPLEQGSGLSATNSHLVLWDKRGW